MIVWKWAGVLGQQIRYLSAQATPELPDSCCHTGGWYHRCKRHTQVSGRSASLCVLRKPHCRTRPAMCMKTEATQPRSTPHNCQDSAHPCASLQQLQGSARTRQDARRFVSHGDASVPPRCLTIGVDVAVARVESKYRSIAGIKAKTAADRHARDLGGTVTALSHIGSPVLASPAAPDGARSHRAAGAPSNPRPACDCLRGGPTLLVPTLPALQGRCVAARCSWGPSRGQDITALT